MKNQEGTIEYPLLNHIYGHFIITSPNTWETQEREEEEEEMIYEKVIKQLKNPKKFMLITSSTQYRKIKEGRTKQTTNKTPMIQTSKTHKPSPLIQSPNLSPIEKIESTTKAKRTIGAWIEIQETHIENLSNIMDTVQTMQKWQEQSYSNLFLIHSWQEYWHIILIIAIYECYTKRQQSAIQAANHIMEIIQENRQSRQLLHHMSKNHRSNPISILRYMNYFTTLMAIQKLPTLNVSIQLTSIETKPIVPSLCLMIKKNGVIFHMAQPDQQKRVEQRVLLCGDYVIEGYQIGKQLKQVLRWTFNTFMIQYSRTKATFMLNVGVDQYDHLDSRVIPPHFTMKLYFKYTEQFESPHEQVYQNMKEQLQSVKGKQSPFLHQSPLSDISPIKTIDLQEEATPPVKQNTPQENQKANAYEEEITKLKEQLEKLKQRYVTTPDEKKIASPSPPPSLSNQPPLPPPPPPPLPIDIPIPPPPPPQLGIPIPPPPPPGLGIPLPPPPQGSEQPKKTPLKVLHWSKINHHNLDQSLWSSPTSESFITEEDTEEIEKLFSKKKVAVPIKKKVSDKPIRVITQTRAQNIEIILASFKNLGTVDKIIEYILELSLSKISHAQIDFLLKCVPTTDEILLLRQAYATTSPTTMSEKFMVGLLNYPKITHKIKTFLYLLEFKELSESIISRLQIKLNVVKSIKTSQSLKLFLKTVLNMGNTLNRGHRVRGNASAFSIELLPKLKETKTNQNTTLLHFILKKSIEKQTGLIKNLFQELSCVAEGLQVKASWIGGQYNKLADMLTHLENDLQDDTLPYQSNKEVLQNKLDESVTHINMVRQHLHEYNEAMYDLKLYLGLPATPYDDVDGLAVQDKDEGFFELLHQFLGDVEQTTKNIQFEQHAASTKSVSLRKSILNRGKALNDSYHEESSLSSIDEDD